MSTVQIRIDPKMKKEAKKIFSEVGFDMSSGIKIYLTQVILTKGIPFPIFTENGLTVSEENEILKASKEAKKGINITKTTTWKKAKAHLNSLKKSK